MFLGTPIRLWNNWRARRKRVRYYASCLGAYTPNELLTEANVFTLAKADARRRRDRGDYAEAAGKLAAVWREVDRRDLGR